MLEAVKLILAPPVLLVTFRPRALRVSKSLLDFFDCSFIAGVLANVVADLDGWLAITT